MDCKRAANPTTHIAAATPGEFEKSGKAVAIRPSEHTTDVATMVRERHRAPSSGKVTKAMGNNM
jgi:hypothetical protein